jgi:hypothetical protein
VFFVKREANAKVFGPAFFKKLVRSRAESPGRRPQTAKSPNAALFSGVNFKNSPVDCFWKRGTFLQKSAPSFALKCFSCRL